MKRVEAEATKRGDKVKVLVAEDNKTNQEVVLRMLKLEDVYDVTVAKDGQEALDLVMESMERQAPYNLIFMDVQMPNLDGLQSTRLIRQSGFSAPIVALTAYAEESNVKVFDICSHLATIVLICHRNALTQAWTSSSRNLSADPPSNTFSKHTVLQFQKKSRIQRHQVLRS
jgi:CheY-like chemotaxis protein